MILLYKFVAGAAFDDSSNSAFAVFVAGAAFAYSALAVFCHLVILLLFFSGVEAVRKQNVGSADSKDHSGLWCKSWKEDDNIFFSFCSTIHTCLQVIRVDRKLAGTGFKFRFLN